MKTMPGAPSRDSNHRWSNFPNFDLIWHICGSPPGSSLRLVCKCSTGKNASHHEAKPWKSHLKHKPKSAIEHLALCVNCDVHGFLYFVVENIAFFVFSMWIAVFCCFPNLLATVQSQRKIKNKTKKQRPPQQNESKPWKSHIKQKPRSSIENSAFCYKCGFHGFALFLCGNLAFFYLFFKLPSYRQELSGTRSQKLSWAPWSSCQSPRALRSSPGLLAGVPRSSQDFAGPLRSSQGLSWAHVTSHELPGALLSAREITCALTIPRARGSSQELPRPEGGVLATAWADTKPHEAIPTRNNPINRIELSGREASWAPEYPNHRFCHKTL